MVRIEPAALDNWMRGLVRGRPPDPLPPETPPPRAERFWPAPDKPIPVPGACIVSRHPAFAAVLPDIPEMKIGRSSRSMQRGRQNRFPSLKAKRVLRAPSSLEFDNMRDVELDTATMLLVEQPIWLRYVLDGKIFKHRPNLFVFWKGSPEFQEVKFENEAAESEAKWVAIAAALNGLGFGYRIRTEDQIRRQPRYKIVRRIYEDRLTPLPDCELLEDIAISLSQRGSIPLSEVNDRWGVARDQIHALIRRGFFAVNLDAWPGPETLLSRGWAKFADIDAAMED